MTINPEHVFLAGSAGVLALVMGRRLLGGRGPTLTLERLLEREADARDREKKRQRIREKVDAFLDGADAPKADAPKS